MLLRQGWALGFDHDHVPRRCQALTSGNRAGGVHGNSVLSLHLVCTSKKGFAIRSRKTQTKTKLAQVIPLLGTDRKQLRARLQQVDPVHNSPGSNAAHGEAKCGACAPPNIIRPQGSKFWRVLQQAGTWRRYAERDKPVPEDSSIRFHR